MTQQQFNWLDTKAYPFTSHYFTVNGQQLHYIDEGEGDVLLFVHGTPSWSFDFRKVIQALQGDFRCVAPDHIGFGLSDKPKTYDYSTINHSKTLEKFVLEKQLDNITLVVHDFGGPIGLHFAMQHPDKVKKLVVLNSWLWSSQDDPDFIKLSKILRSPLLPFLYLYLNFSPRFILPKSFGDHTLPNEVKKQYTKPFANKDQRYGALAFAKSLLHDQEWFEALWQKRKVISDKPTLFIWGMKDPTIKPKNLTIFQSGFQHHTTLQLENSGHFPQEEEPDEVAKAIIDFMG